MENLSKAEQFILREYETRTKQMQHEDRLRDYLLRYIIIFFTLIITTIFYLFIDKRLDNVPNEINNLIFAFLILIAISVWIIIIIIAKIRKAQLLWMNIEANIRTYFFKEKYELYNITILSQTTIRPEPNILSPSQTLLTILIISFFNSFYICSLLYLFKIYQYQSSSLCFFCVFALLLFGHYFTFKIAVTLSEFKPYSLKNPPWPMCLESHMYSLPTTYK